MKGSECFQVISAGAISASMPQCIAILVNVGGSKGVLSVLQQMYSTRNDTVFAVDTSLEKLPQVLERGREIVITSYCGHRWHEQTHCGRCHGDRL